MSNNAKSGTGSNHEDCPTNRIDESNPFRDQIIDLASDGYSWNEILELLEEAYGPIDEAAMEESKEYIPVFEVRAVVYDENSTSQERFETFEVAMDTEQQAEDWAKDHKGAIRVEDVRQVDEMGVYT